MRKISFCIGLLFLLPGTLMAQQVDSLVMQGQHLETAMQEAAALKKYEQAAALDSTNVTALSRASILYTRQGRRQKTTKAASPYFLEARALAEKALRRNSNDRDANLAMGKALRELSLTAGAKQKAAYIKEVKTYIDKLLLIDSTFAPAWHLSGDWNMEVSSLNFAERAATRLLFGGLPQASVGQAIADYSRSQKLDPSNIETRYDLARALHADHKDLDAISTLQQALRLRPIRQDDRDIQKACREMIQQLQ
jgi:tetratricopeptide (TPR) repeat protein